MDDNNDFNLSEEDGLLYAYGEYLENCMTALRVVIWAIVAVPTFVLFCILSIVGLPFIIGDYYIRKGIDKNGQQN